MIFKTTKYLYSQTVAFFKTIMGFLLSPFGVEEYEAYSVLGEEAISLISL